MFKAELSDSSILKTSFDAISSIVDEVQIQTDSEGMRLDALDRSHITFVHLELKSSLFDEYICDVPEKINIDTDEFMRVLKRAKSQDRVLMSVDEGNFIITFEGDATRTFKIRLIDMEYDNPVPPQINHPTTFKVRFSILKDSINDIDIFSDKIALQVDEDYFMASADGEFGDARVCLWMGTASLFPCVSLPVQTTNKQLLSPWKSSLQKCLKEKNLFTVLMPVLVL